MRMSFFTLLKQIIMSFLATSKQIMNAKTMLLAFSAFALMACGSPVDLKPKKGIEIAATQTSPAPIQQPVETVSDVQVTTVEPEVIEVVDLPPPTTASVVYFDLDSYVIAPPYQKMVADNANYLSANRNRSVVLEGHTDDRGGREYNLALGQKRAEAVMLALRVLGVDPNQMEAVSFGEESPADPRNNESAWAQNRRVVIRYK